MFKKFSTFLICLALIFSGCTKSGGGSSDSSDNTNRPTDGSQFLSNCGTLIEEVLENPVDTSMGYEVTARVIAPNILAVQLGTGEQLLKLHNLDAPTNNVLYQTARDYLESMTSGTLIFFPAGSDCSTRVEGGGLGTLGQLYTQSGQNISESMLDEGFAKVGLDPCGGSQLMACYQAIEDQASARTAGEIGRLLWKPVSDSNGRLAVHTDPYGTTVVVNGETGSNSGPGNGYGSLARFGKAGCSYGSATVQVFNESGIPYSFGGASSLKIPNGCSRYCYDNGNLVACSK